MLRSTDSWSQFIRRLQGEERRREERREELEPHLLLRGLLSRDGAAGWRWLRKWKEGIGFIWMPVVS